MNTVVHFEMPYTDRKRVAKFYEEAFGWRIQMLGEEMGNYMLATTVPEGSKLPGGINGGFAEKSEEFKAPLVVVAVENIEEAQKRVIASGGKILSEVHPIPNVGKYVALSDSEGNRICMLEPTFHPLPQR